MRLLLIVLCCAPSFVSLAEEPRAPLIVTSIGGSAQVEQEITIRDSENSQQDARKNIVARDSDQPVRLIVKLEEPALAPYLQMQKSKMAIGQGRLKSADRQALEKAVQSQRQKLRGSQQQLAAKMRSDRLVSDIHHEFIYLINAMAVTARPRDMDKISQLPGVAAVYLDNKVKALLEESTDLLELPTIWQRKDKEDRTLTGQGIRVAILDTGIDYRHPDLGGCLGQGCKVIAAYNFVEDDDADDGMDVFGHGTHVAGIVAANGELRGVAPDASLYSFKVLNDYGTGDESWIIAGLERAADLDGDPLTDDAVDIINMSLGGSGGLDSPVSEAANAAMDAGIIVVVAAGNSGSRYSTIDSPGNAERVITVGASDNNDFIAYFSSRGPVPGASYIKPELVAPGVDIRSMAPDGGYKLESGTSMASPHVAGAAALLKQMHPDFNPQEIKSLLIANTQSIAEDVFVQGAGRLDISAALDAKFILTPALIHFGDIDIQAPAWQASVSLAIKNISGAAQRISLSSGEQLPPGAALTLASPTSATIASGATGSWDVTMAVHNAAMPFPDNASMHYESALKVSHGLRSLRVPLALTKSAKINIDTSEGLFLVNIYKDDGSFADLYRGDCAMLQSFGSIPVKPGRYSFVFQFFEDESCSEETAFVFKESVKVATTANIKASPADAIYEVTLDSVINSLGETIPIEEFRTKYVAVDHNHVAVGGGSWGKYSFSGSRMFRISGFSNKFRLSISPLVELKENEHDGLEYYLSQKIFIDGMNRSLGFSLDARKMGSINFEYKDYPKLASGVKFRMDFISTEAFSGEYASGHSLVSPEVYFQPFKVKIFRDLVSLQINEFYPVLRIYENESEKFYLPDIFRSGLLAFFDMDSYAVIKGPFGDKNTIVYESESNDMVVENNGYFFSAALVFSKYLNAIRLEDSINFINNYGLQRDERQNSFWGDFFYQLSCDQRIITEGELDSYSQYLDLTNNTCSQIGADIRMQTRFLGVADESLIEFRLNTKSTIYADSLADVESPIIEEISFINDGKLSRILTENAQVRVRLGRPRVQSGIVRNFDLQLEYRLDDVSSWLRLPLVKRGDIYTAKMPIASGAHLGSLRVSVKDKDGNSLTQILNSVFLIGSGELPERYRPPVFAELEPLQIEATGLLTQVALSAPIAVDAIDGDVIAVTNLGDTFPLGVNLIEWTATNSRGLVATSFQTLNIIDTTPPTISLVPSISVEATGILTEVNLGVVAAVDLVDGVVPVSADTAGPFALGTTYVNWTAFDNSGNTVTTTQTVVVTAKPVAPPPAVQPTSSKSSGGGSSGVIALWILFVCLLRLWFLSGMPNKFYRFMRSSTET